jgi:hypothetical protein
MNIEKLVSVIRSLAQLDSYDSTSGVLNLAQLVWQAEGLIRTEDQKYWRKFDNACRNYLRVYQTQIASNKAQLLAGCLSVETPLPPDQFPMDWQWDECLSTAAADIYAAYIECLKENGTGSRQLTGKKGGGK